VVAPVPLPVRLLEWVLRVVLRVGFRGVLVKRGSAWISGRSFLVFFWEFWDSSDKRRAVDMVVTI
jgi:hypothetical protein